MNKGKMKRIEGIRILNSHAKWTNEFRIHLSDGRSGRGSAPQGETTSIYEGNPVSLAPSRIIGEIVADGILGNEYSQEQFDRYLETRFPALGRNNRYALSVAYFEALSIDAERMDAKRSGSNARFFPKLCMNVLNGGNYAYTNPVRSDYAEFLLIPRHDDLSRMLNDHRRIQCRTREGLLGRSHAIVNGNVVHEIGGNPGAVEFLGSILEELGLRESYDVMIDASAGNLKTRDGYQLAITGEGHYTSEEFVAMWKEFIRNYGVSVLEDPFAEDDFDAWKALTADRLGCHIVGDNLYSSDAGRIAQGSRERWSTGVVLKPDQSGSVTRAHEAAEACSTMKQLMISSHRSISTESMFVVAFSIAHRIPYLKVGPLLTDYSAVMRINEFLRIAGGAGWEEQPS